MVLEVEATFLVVTRHQHLSSDLSDQKTQNKSNIVKLSSWDAVQISTKTLGDDGAPIIRPIDLADSWSGPVFLTQAQVHGCNARVQENMLRQMLHTRRVLGGRIVTPVTQNQGLPT